MLKNFSSLKSELLELAKVLNSFQSEAVQLRLLELLLGNGVDASESERKSRKGARTHRKKTASQNKGAISSSKGKSPKTKKLGKKRIGGYSMIENLISEGFFKDKRTASDIIDHCKKNKATTYKPNEFSSKLSNLTRQGILKREKNSDSQYEYWTV